MLRKMASNETMTESRVQALTALLPNIRTKVAFGLKSFQNHLARGAKNGFLTDDEMFEVFSSDNAAKHVDILFKILKGKDNAAFDGFCSILEEHGYGHWSAKLQMKVSAIYSLCLRVILAVDTPNMYSHRLDEPYRP